MGIDHAWMEMLRLVRDWGMKLLKNVCIGRPVHQRVMRHMRWEALYADVSLDTSLVVYIRTYSDFIEGMFVNARTKF